MNRPAWLIAALLLSGCTTLKPAPPGEDAGPLARRWPAPGTPELMAYRDYWCARDAQARSDRRARLDARADAVELLLLEYCDLAAKPVVAAGARDDSPLARRDPAATPAQLLDYQRAWCASGTRERRERRAGLRAPDDSLEILLLDYCDEARRNPRDLGQRLRSLEQERRWPPGYEDLFAWLQWHLEAFAANLAEATAQRLRMQGDIDKLRAIERDISTRDPGAGLPQ